MSGLVCELMYGPGTGTCILNFISGRDLGQELMPMEQKKSNKRVLISLASITASPNAESAGQQPRLIDC